MGNQKIMKFVLGHIFTTPAVNEVLSIDEIYDLLIRHGTLEQGELGEEDYKMNLDAVKNGDRIFSCFKKHDEKFYVITEWDRSITTVLKPEEY